MAIEYNESGETGRLLVTTFMQYLEEFADTESSIAIPELEVEQMAKRSERFVAQVRQMGRMGSAEGRLVIPTSVLRRAAA